MVNDPGLFRLRCAECKQRPADLLCDYVIKYHRNIIFYRSFKLFTERNSPGIRDTTCSVPLCSSCAHNHDGADLCPFHHNIQQQAARIPEKYMREWRQQDAIAKREWHEQIKENQRKSDEDRERKKYDR